MYPGLGRWQLCKGLVVVDPDAVVFPPGSRVKVLSDPDYGPGPWPAEPTGRVVSGPDVVDVGQGTRTFYWIVFDEPQRDADGDGPYERAQVLDTYLIPLTV